MGGFCRTEPDWMFSALQGRIDLLHALRSHQDESSNSCSLETTSNSMKATKRFQGSHRFMMNRRTNKRDSGKNSSFVWRTSFLLLYLLERCFLSRCCCSVRVLFVSPVFPMQTDDLPDCWRSLPVTEGVSVHRQHAQELNQNNNLHNYHHQNNQHHDLNCAWTGVPSPFF